MMTEQLADSLFDAIRKYVGRAIDAAVAPLREKTAERGQAGEKGERGEPGAKGDRGDPGERGEKGDPGERGDAGEKGERGEPGEKGADGTDGRDGRDGKDGPPGKDAMQLDVLDCIDLAHRYPRGTCAHHRGGIIRAFRSTDPITDSIEKAGWHVIVNALAGLGFAQVDERTFKLVVHQTDGSVVEHQFAMPVVIDRGIYREGHAYAKGDGVTWAGSYWIAQQDTQGAKPNAGTGEWRLAVKAGRDGKDGVAGPKGEPGAKGESGRNYDGAKW